VRSNPLGKLLATRWVVRAPIGLYRARLGFVFGHRLLLLEHIGRRSGTRREVVLEVVERRGRDTYVIVSGFGTKAQWYRNVIAQPQVRVSVGWQVHRPALAVALDDDDAARTLDFYATRHARAWRRLQPALAAVQDDANPKLPMFAVTLEP
jgi:deazaflavin-dependent oxidoreductase (nitroreductase family)